MTRRVLVYSKKDFPEAVEENLGNNIAYIQINNSDDDNFYLKESNTVCCLKFDDLSEESNNSFNTVYANKVLNFINENLGKDFIICCPAGLSRSQGIAYFILNYFPEYIKSITNPDNPCNTPNYLVVNILSRELRKNQKN